MYNDYRDNIPNEFFVLNSKLKLPVDSKNYLIFMQAKVQDVVPRLGFLPALKKDVKEIGECVYALATYSTMGICKINFDVLLDDVDNNRIAVSEIIPRMRKCINAIENDRVFRNYKLPPMTKGSSQDF